MPDEIEILWLQVHLAHLKPILIGCCYRHPTARSWYLDIICDMLDQVTCTNYEIYLLGDLNINYKALTCPMKSKLVEACAGCGLSQEVTKPTRISFNEDGIRVATCIDHIYVNTPEVCSAAISVAMGFSDHNLIAIVRKTKVPKPGVKILRKRSYKHFNVNNYVDDVRNADWSEVFSLQDPEEALKTFNRILISYRHPCTSKKVPPG